MGSGEKYVTIQLIFKFGFIGLLNLAVGEGLAPPEIRKNIR